MAELRQTNVFDKHYHLAYILSPEEGTTDAGATSIDGDTKKQEDQHYHKVVYVPEVAAVIDDQGQETQAAIPGYFTCTKNEGKDPHTHTIEELKFIKRVPMWMKTDEDDDVKEIRQLYEEAKKQDGDYLKQSQEDEKFYMGDQWDSSDKNKLKAKKRACLTLNEIEGKIDTLSGFYRQSRYDITYFPTENGDQLVADILSNLAKHVQEQNSFDYREVEVFEDKAITGRGNYKIWIDYNKDIRGDIKIRDFPYDKVVYGEHRDKDCDDLEYLVAWEWVSKNKLKQLHPDKEEQIDDWMEISRLKNSTGASSDIPEDYRDKYATDSKNDTKDGWVDFGSSQEYVDPIQKKFKLLELHKKVYEKVNILANLNDQYIEDGFFFEDLPKDSRDKVATIPGMTKIPRTLTSIAIMQSAGAILLSKDESEFKDNWTVIPDYAKKRGNNVWGKVRGMKDLQKMINKMQSNSIDIVARMAVYGWMYDSQTFNGNDRAKQKFLAQSSTPGFVLEVGSVSAPPLKFEGSRYPNELVQTQEFLSRKMNENSNITPELLGQSSQSQQSGVSFNSKREGALVGNEFLFDNSSLSKRMLGRALLRAIKVVFGADPERVVKLLKNRISRGNQVVVGDKAQDLDKFPLEQIMEVLNNDDYENYDVVVGEAEYSPTRKQAIFTYMLQLAQAGLQIPPTLFYELSELPLYIKRQIQAYNDDVKNSEKGQADSKQRTEIYKTIIAALPDDMKQNPQILSYLANEGLGQTQPQQGQEGQQQQAHNTI